jgi:RNA polymerase sigma-70 factor (ECF subfamily)
VKVTRDAAPAATAVQLRGADVVARQALAFSRRAEHARVGVVDGEPAILVTPGGRLAIVMTFDIAGGRIAAIDIIADRTRLAALTIEPGE